MSESVLLMLVCVFSPAEKQPGYPQDKNGIIINWWYLVKANNNMIYKSTTG